MEPEKGSTGCSINFEGRSASPQFLSNLPVFSLQILEFSMNFPTNTRKYLEKCVVEQ